MAIPPKVEKQSTSTLARILMVTCTGLTILLAIMSSVPGIKDVTLAPLLVSDRSLLVIGVSSVFLAITLVLATWLSLVAIKDPPAKPSPIENVQKQNTSGTSTLGLNANDILQASFEFASDNASQAMEHRMTIVNFYLLIAGGVGSAVGAMLAANDRQNLEIALVGLLWIVSLIGWLTLFKLIRLRTAWVESAAEMNYIKEFYIRNSSDFPAEVLRRAFYFRFDTIPKAFTPWNVFHLSALLLALLDAFAYLGGIMIFILHTQIGEWSIWTVVIAMMLAVIMLMGHAWAFEISLKPSRKYIQKMKSQSVQSTSQVAQTDSHAGSSLPTQKREPSVQPASYTPNYTASANAVVDSQTIYQGSVISLHVDDVRLPDGRTAKREIVGHGEAVVIVAYLADSDEILFIEQYRDAIKQALLELPAGLLQEDENHEQTARREFLEETGYTADTWRLIGSYYTSPGFTNELHHLFLATNLHQVSGVQDNDEIHALHRIKRADAMELIQEHKLHDGKSILGLLWSYNYLPSNV
jgi:ADP-ribose pyrophosphatase